MELYYVKEMRFVLQIGAARDSIAIQKALNLGVNLTGQCLLQFTVNLVWRIACRHRVPRTKCLPG